MKLVREYINERFEEESDPIEDMGIGIKHLLDIWEEEYEKEGELSIEKSSFNYFGSPHYTREVWLIYYILKNIRNADSLEKAKNIAVKEILLYKETNKLNRLSSLIPLQKIINILFKKYSLDLRDNKYLKKYI